MDKAEQLKEIAAQVSVCQRCGLHSGRKLAVPGEGPAEVDLMFIGEGPGFHENEQGRPFVGQAGKLLSDLLGKNSLEREKVFITNVVKCRPPGNRDPQPDELLACAHYLDRQIEILNPKVIVTLGRYSMYKFFPNARISAIHGQAAKVGGRLVVAMYHPAAALHQPALMPELVNDFSFLPKWVEQASRSDRIEGGQNQAAPPPVVTSQPPEEDQGAVQLSLF